SSHSTTTYLTCTSINTFLSNPPPSSEIYTLSLHDALPIFHVVALGLDGDLGGVGGVGAQRDGCVRVGAQILGGLTHRGGGRPPVDRKSTRLNSSHVKISYAVFCLKKKKKNVDTRRDCRSDK